MTTLRKCLRRAPGLCLAVLLSAGVAVAAHPDARMAEAARRQDKALVRALLKGKAADVNARQADGTTALFWAAQWDDLETADLLIAAGADVHAVNDYGVSPLAMAATNGSAAMVSRLLRAGANPNAALPTGETALMSAALTGRLEAVKALVDAGADLNLHGTAKGQTALMWAIVEGTATSSGCWLTVGPTSTPARLRGSRRSRLLLARTMRTRSGYCSERAPTCTPRRPTGPRCSRSRPSAATWIS